MKKLILCSLLITGCALPHYETKPDADFKYSQDFHTRLNCDVNSNHAAVGMVQILALVEPFTSDKVELTLKNFVLKESNAVERSATKWRFINMEGLYLNINGLEGGPKAAQGDMASTTVGNGQASLILLEFNRPKDPNFLFQIKDGDKVFFSARCQQPEDQLKGLKDSMKNVPNSIRQH